MNLLFVFWCLLGSAAASALPLGSPHPGQEWPEVPRQGSYLGINISNVPPDQVASLRLKNASGAEVTMVDHDAPAGKAGLREHDVIVGFNGNPVTNEDQLRNFVRQTPPGTTVTLDYMRAGQAMKVQVTLADRDADRPLQVPPGDGSGDPRLSGPFPMPDFDMPGINFVALRPDRSRAGKPDPAAMRILRRQKRRRRGAGAFGREGQSRGGSRAESRRCHRARRKGYGHRHRRLASHHAWPQRPDRHHRHPKEAGGESLDQPAGSKSPARFCPRTGRPACNLVTKPG